MVVHENGTYEFGEQFGRGQRGEDLLDNHFARTFDIRVASRSQERRGIDRIFTSKKDVVYTVQYKFDEVAARTGNIFVETVSADRSGVPGWIYTCEANMLIVLIPKSWNVYAFKVTDMQLHIDDWIRKYRVKAVPNNGYWTYGVPVPEAVAASVAFWNSKVKR